LASNGAFGLISRKIQSEQAERAKLLKDKQPPASIDYAAEVKSNFVQKMAVILPVKAYLTKHGYADKWAKYDIDILYASYAVLKCKNLE
jgi:hypothetical protein